MKALRDLGFIQAKQGACGEFHFILLLGDNARPGCAREIGTPAGFLHGLSESPTAMRKFTGAPLAEDSTHNVGGLADSSARVLAPALRQFLRSRFRLVADHEDLVQQTLSDLHRFLRTRLPERPYAGDELRALAFSILKRRVADRFRNEARSFAALELGTARNEQSLEPSAETVAGYRELLGTVLNFIAEMDGADRQLLLSEALGTDRSGSLPPAERQRLSRLRERLRKRLAGLGVSSEDMKPESHD